MTEDQVLTDRIKIQTLSPDQQQTAREICREDPIWYVNHFLFTFDPRPEGAPHHLPFILYDYEEKLVLDLIERVRSGRDLLIEKSRDMGVTWTILAAIQWLWMFEPGFVALLGSRKEDLVDSAEDPAALFWRLEYFNQRLPAWILPKGFSAKIHDTYLSLKNPENGNVITGESANPSFGRQGRSTVVLLDEFAFWDYARAAWQGTGDNAHCRIAVSTPNPNVAANFFKELRHSGLVEVLTLHWKLHPNKDDAWYEAEKKRRTPSEVAAELDISYEPSTRGIVYPEWLQIPKGNGPYRQGDGLFTSSDFGIGDDHAIVWWAKDPLTGEYRAVDSYANSGKSIDFYVPFYLGSLDGVDPQGNPFHFSRTLYTAEELGKIESHRGWPQAIHFGDPAGGQRNEVTATSVIIELGRYGIYVFTRPDVKTFEARWNQTKLFLRLVTGIHEPTCAPLDEAMRNARFPERDETSQAVTAITKPIHDWTSHLRTAVEYMAVNVDTDRPNPRAPEKVGAEARIDEYLRRKSRGPVDPHLGSEY